MLQAGDKAPDFTLPEARGGQIGLGDFPGKTVVVYFYPKDNTPGCTTEACSFRDSYRDILDKGAVVLGISPDSETSHQKFMGKYDLPFYLLSDADREVAQAFGVYGEKKLYGKTTMGIIRSTFIIGPDGVIQKVFPKVTPKEHGAEILAALY